MNKGKNDEFYARRKRKELAEEAPVDRSVKEATVEGEELVVGNCWCFCWGGYPEGNC